MSSLAATGVRCDWGGWTSHWQLDLWGHTQPHHLCPGAGSPSTWALVPSTDIPGPLRWPQKTWHQCARAQGHAVLSLAHSLGCSPRWQGPGHPCHVLVFHCVTSALSPAASRGLSTGPLGPQPPCPPRRTPRSLPPHSHLPRHRSHIIFDAGGVSLLWNPPPFGRGDLPRKGASFSGSSVQRGHLLWGSRPGNRLVPARAGGPHTPSRSCVVAWLTGDLEFCPPKCKPRQAGGESRWGELWRRASQGCQSAFQALSPGRRRPC